MVARSHTVPWRIPAACSGEGLFGEYLETVGGVSTAIILGSAETVTCRPMLNNSDYFSCFTAPRR